MNGYSFFMPKISDARKAERRRQILRAATTCFAKRGFHETTILDICAEAGLSAGAVYSYFDSKNAIIGALAERGRALAGERTESAKDGTDPIERLAVFLRELGQPGNAKINQYDVRGWAEAIGNRQLRDIHLRARDETIKTLSDIVAPIAAQHGFKPDDLAEFILAIIVGCETRRAIQTAADLRPVLDVLLTLLSAKPARKRA